MLIHRQQYLAGFVALTVLLCSVAWPQSKPAPPFPLELDHVFIWVTRGAPEAKTIENAGLKALDEISKHTGQGTSSRVFIFENAYLELIWIDDEQAATKNATRTGIDMLTRANWKQTKASPFGIGLHRIPGATTAIPFPVIEYWAEWMKENTLIHFAKAVSSRKEPMYFVLPDYIAIPDAATREKQRQTNPDYERMLKHPLGVSKLTNVRISTVEKALTETAGILTRNGVVRIESGRAPLMELTFDGGAQKKAVDLQPQLPLVIRY